MTNKSGPIYTISRNDTYLKIIDLNNNNIKNAEFLEKKIYTMIHYSYTIYLIINEDKSRLIEQFNLENKTFTSFNFELTSPIGLFLTKNKLMIIFSHDNSNMYCYSKNINSGTQPKTILLFPFENFFGFIQSIELSKNFLVSCFLYQNKKELYCFSGQFNDESYKMVINPKQIISGCSQTDSFSFYKQNTEFGLLACIGASFILYKINSSLESELILIINKYYYVDFVPLNDNKMFFGLVKKDKNVFKIFQSVYFLPSCPKSPVYPTLSTPFYFLVLFEQIEKGISDKKQIMFETLPSYGKISSEDTTIEEINVKKNYKIDSLYYVSDQLIEEKIEFFMIDDQTTGDTISSEKCTLTFTICNERCKTCVSPNNRNKQKCKTCNNEKGYYLIADKDNECIPIEEKPSDYYFNLDLAAFFRCNKNCASCEKGGNEEQNNCLTCIDNFYITEKTSNCIKSGMQPTNYYFDQQDNIYIKSAIPYAINVKLEEIWKITNA